jgi:hypothetical protein
MKFKLFLSTVLFTAVTAVTARQIHGVGGFYNWTSAQMQSSGILSYSNGTKFNNYVSSLEYQSDDLKINLGVNSTTNNGGYPWRTTVTVKDGSMTITKNYPVLALKFSMATNNLTKGQSNDDLQMFVEHWWYNPYTGVRELMKNANYNGLKGFGSNGRFSYVYEYPWVICKDTNNYNIGRDSVKLAGMNAISEHYLSSNGILWTQRTGSAITAAAIDTSIVVMRLPSSSNEKAEYIALLNYDAIADSSSLAATSKRLLDRMDIKLSDFYFNFFARRDTVVNDTTINGTDTTVTKRAITSNERPVVYMKWMKTFKSIGDVWTQMTADNNWGDGTESAQKSSLNYALYYAEQNLTGFVWRNTDPSTIDDPAYIAYQKAYNTANEVYSNTSSTNDDYASAAASLQIAKVALYQSADFDSTLVYNYLINEGGGGSIVLGKDSVTVGTLKGLPLTIGSDVSAYPFTFKKTGDKTEGQNTYYISTTKGNVVQAPDGTLLLMPFTVPGSKFTFTQRDKENKGYDIKCGSYYYYIDFNNGSLKCSKTLTASMEQIDDMMPFLFNVKDALADYNNKISDEEKSNLFTAWEFNGSPVEDPSTHGYVTANGISTEKTMSENSETKMTDGWRMSRWRMQSRVNQETVKNNDGTSAVCLVLSSAPSYDSYDGATTGIENDYTTAPAMRRDAGTTVPFYNRDPSPRDSSLAINLNAGYTRYFAVKMISSAEDISIARFNFLLGTGTDGLVLSTANAAGAKGNVIYWDMLQCGATVGKQLYISQFISTNGFAKAGEKLFIDWMRTYSSIETIPSEIFDITTGVENVNNTSAQIFVNDGVITTFDNADIYSITGAKIAHLQGTSHISVQPGMYIVRIGSQSKKIIVR